MIKEQIIEAVIAKMESEDFQDLFVEQQPQYWSYLNSDSFKGLTDDEHQLLFFINSVIYHAILDSEVEYEDFDIEFFQELEEANWDLREAQKSWDKAKDAFFDKYPEEDLLAFAEDMLADEEEEVSDISKEVILVTAKSYLDLLLVPS